jgi:phosphate transport system protein
MERQVDIQLEKLKTKLIKMCSLVDEQVDFAYRTFPEENAEIAQIVIDRDNKVDKYDNKIDKICQKIIALNQPVAMDLRVIMSALTINTNLERIGDLTVNISQSFLKAKKKPEFIDRTKYDEMVRVSKEMLKNAIDAYMQNDAKLAQKVIQSDDILDKCNYENLDILINIMKENPDNIDLAVEMINVSRDIERIGDHATNIAEDVFFIVQAQMIKHKYEKYFFSEENEQEDDDI